MHTYLGMSQKKSPFQNPLKKKKKKKKKKKRKENTKEGYVYFIYKNRWACDCAWSA